MCLRQAAKDPAFVKALVGGNSASRLLKQSGLFGSPTLTAPVCLCFPSKRANSLRFEVQDVRLCLAGDYRGLSPRVYKFMMLGLRASTRTRTCDSLCSALGFLGHQILHVLCTINPLSVSGFRVRKPHLLVSSAWLMFEA